MLSAQIRRKSTGLTRDGVGGIVIFTGDITDQKQAEDVLRKTLDKLEAANRELEAFVYSVSHDLRAPARIVAEFAKIVLEDYAGTLDAQGKDYLTRIRDGAERMSGLIEDLLRLSRISRHHVDPVDCDLSRVASEIVTRLREAEPARTVEVVIAEGLRTVVDPNLINVALTNLLENAWKFSSKTENARIEFGTARSDGNTVYYVNDNGAGFDTTCTAKMFMPFQRLHSEKEFAGTGIGLTIVERIIRRHGGTIWAEGEVGKGATFFFTLGQRQS